MSKSLEAIITLALDKLDGSKCPPFPDEELQKEMEERRRVTQETREWLVGANYSEDILLVAIAEGLILHHEDCARREKELLQRLTNRRRT